MNGLRPSPHVSSTLAGPVRRLGPAIAGLATMALLISGCGLSAGVPESVIEAPAKATAPAVSKPAGKLGARAGSGADEFYKVTMKITNSTNRTFWITSAVLGHENEDGGNWDDRPSNLTPGMSETVSAYSAVQGQGIRLVFTDPTDHTSTVTLEAQDPATGKNNYDGTKATPPVQVSASITDGLHTVATYTIHG